MAKQTVASVHAFALQLQGEIQALTARITELESASTALPLPAAPRQGTQSPSRSKPTNPMLGLLVRLGEFPDFDAAVAAGWTYEQAKAKLDAWAQLFKGVPKPVQVKCVHCEVGHHETSAQVRECWESRVRG